MLCKWRGWNGLTCIQKQSSIVHDNLLLLVDCWETEEHRAVFYNRYQSSVVCKEKLQRGFLGSYNGISGGHFAAIHRVDKMLDKNSFATFYSFMRVDISGSE
jgi:hypothetical protein